MTSGPDAEAEAVEAVLSAEPGDRLRLRVDANIEGEREAEITVVHREERPGAVGVRGGRSDDLVFWVVRGRFLFVTTRGGELMLTGEHVGDGGGYIELVRGG